MNVRKTTSWGVNCGELELQEVTPVADCRRLGAPSATGVASYNQFRKSIKLFSYGFATSAATSLPVEVLGGSTVVAYSAIARL